MSRIVFHPSIEGAQHGGKSLAGFLEFARRSGARGAEPSNYLIQDPSGGFLSAGRIREELARAELLLDGISCHCIFWAHTTAWTGSKTIRPFLPEDVRDRAVEKIEAWCEDYLFRFMDLCAELEVRIVPMFWGVASGFEVASGYPWAFWSGPGYDLVQEGIERFVTKTARLRERANELGLFLAHEIHPNSAAMTAGDFEMLVQACDEDRCLAVTADPSHCWEHETPELRFRRVAGRVYAAAVKNFVVRPGVPLRNMTGRWPERAMQFVDLPSGDLNLVRFVELLVDIGYPRRYCEVMKRETAPLVVEAESAFRDLDATGANGIAYVRDHLCFPLAQGSFEEGMGA